MSDWEDFVDLDNLRLAWDRTIRSMHADTKDRLALRAFNFSLDRNLRLLADRLDDETYKSSPALKMYQPKKDGTLRTIPVLTVSDRIVYQGVCNIIAARTAPDFQMVANRQVYAHLPAALDSEFAIRPWQRQYRGFIKALERAWYRGNRWLAKTDIASFYDSIDHSLLVEILRDRWSIDQRLLDLLKASLHTWSPHIQERYLGKGLPQGYEASDFLSTLFLIMVDRDMCEKGYDTVYRRYSDDIRMLLPREDLALRALIDIDLSMKSVGLIIQTSKTTVEKVTSLDDQRDPQWGLLSLIDRDPYLESEHSQGQLRQIFFDSARELETNEFAERHLVFVLWRLKPYDDARDQALLLLDTMPWRSDRLTQYLYQFKGDPYASKRLLDFVEEHRLYGWHLANCLRCLSHISQSDDLYSVCQSWLKDTNLPWPQRLAAAEALSGIPESAALCDIYSDKEENALVRKALLASSYKLADGDLASQRRVIRKMLQDGEEEIVRTGLYFIMASSELSWEDFSDLKTHLDSLRALVPELTPIEQVERECFVSKTLSDFFEIDGASRLSFENILGKYYDAAKGQLREAIRAHDTSPSRYVCRMDNFNNILTWSIYEHHLLGINYQKEETINNWNRREFRDLCPVIVGAFLECHKVRSNCAEPHPYSASLGAVSEEVSYPERNRITASLKAAFVQLVQLFL